MARVLLICPFCQKKLETSDENIGREGQCPGCERIFPITSTGRAGAAGGGAAEGWLGAAGEYEYRETTALAVAGAVAICLLLLTAASAMRWVKAGHFGEDLVALYRAAFLAASIGCALFLVVSFLGRKSLAPAVLLSGGWGMVAVIWAGGLLQTMAELARDMPYAEEVSQNVAVAGGLHLALVAAVLVVGAAVLFWYLCRDGETFARIGTFMAVALVLALGAGFYILFTYVKPPIKGAAGSLRRRTSLLDAAPHVVASRDPAPSA